MPKKKGRKPVKRLGTKEPLGKNIEISKKNNELLEEIENKELETEDKRESQENNKLKELVLKWNKMEMPDDFYEFLEFCRSINPEDPKNALNDIDIQLVGLYDLLLTNLETDYKLYYRYFYDPPEFQTVLKGIDELMLHFGYFRDDPSQLPSFVALNEAKIDCIIFPKGENLFSAVNWYLDELILGKKYKTKLKESSIRQLKDKLLKWCDKKYSLELKTPKIKTRDKTLNCKTFHNSGLCVPITADGFGYRDLPHSYDSIKNFLKNYLSNDLTKKAKAEDLIQETITLIQFANDESDYGMGLEFGLCLFSYGDKSLHKYVKMLLNLGYTLVGRNHYADIITAHLNKREICVKV